MAQIQVTIVEGKNLKKKDWFSESDSYIEVYINNKKNKKITKVKPNSKDPVWNETFSFDDLKDENFLFIDVYDKDFVFDDKIGSIIMDLKDLYQKKHFEGWYDLPSKRELASNGQIHLKLEYQSTET